MNKDWEKIFASNDRFKAELLKAMLVNYNIDCVIVNRQDSSYLAFGDIELYVRREDVLRSLNLIRKYEEVE